MAAKDVSRNGRREVLTALPNARPARRSAKRGGSASAQEAAGGDVAAATPGGRAPSATRPKASAAKRGPAAKGGTAAAKPAARASGTTSRRASSTSGRAVPPAGYATPKPSDSDGRALRGGDLVTTALQAAGEVAQIGLTAGVQGLRGALRRLPKL